MRPPYNMRDSHGSEKSSFPSPCQHCPGRGARRRKIGKLRASLRFATYRKVEPEVTNHTPNPIWAVTPVAIPKTAPTAMSGTKPDWHMAEAIPARATTVAKIDANEARRWSAQKSKNAKAIFSKHLFSIISEIPKDESLGFRL